MYVKNFHGVSEFAFEDITYWNVGQQFNWIRHYPDGITQKYVYNHLTGYNLSTDLGADKELFGNSDGATEATLDIEMTNSIFHTQLSGNEGSLKFNNTSERHTININNNVLYQVAPIFDLGGTINKSNNMEGTDPMFVDPDNGDFTVMNSALYGAASDGEIIGARYWHPDFVDDFSDLNSSVNDFLKEKYALKNYPNPFVDNTNLSFKLEESAEVELVIYDLKGKMVGKVFEGPLPQGVHTIQFDATNLNPGLYFYQLRSQGEVISSKMIKL
jgi:hypothetical protein